jgi:predicted nuclease of restriction endonuclease-like (RecB) superfamily
MSKLIATEYANLLAEVKERVRAGQYAALRAVNRELVALYWDIGRMISIQQITGMHGDAVVEQLAADLRMEFPAVGGFSRRNVFYMREFYITYHDLPKVQPLVAQIGWTQNVIILQRCKGPLEREFYITYHDLPKVQPLVHKSDGPRTSSSFSAAKDLWNGNSTSA